jgi:hypothetical protein
MGVSIIGGADGPTSVFLAGRLGGGWINIFGLCIVIAILIPNIIYAIRYRSVKNKCTNKIMNVLEQIGRYACMFFLIVHVGKTEFAFQSIGVFLIYLIGNALLILTYWIVWGLYFIKQSKWKSMTLAVIPTVIFGMSGITLQHGWLVVAAVLFGIGHIYVTWQNLK